MSWQRTFDGGDLGQSPNAEYYDYSRLQSDQDLAASSETHELSIMRAHHTSTNSFAPLIASKSAQDDNSKSTTVPSGTFRFRRRFTGWKVGITMCALTTSVVCLLNIIVTIWAISNHKLEEGFAQLFQGSCAEVANMSLWIHLAINVMSTLLLSASNYTMQILSSPTRKEVDRAHSKKQWLDIGIPSTRNLRAISGKRILMWIALAFSSIPLHLMYNTAIFSSLTANAYDRIVISPGFLADDSAANNFGKSVFLTNLHQKAINGSLQRYEPADCMAEYAATFVSRSRNVLLVTTENVKDPKRVRGKTVLADGMTWKGDSPIPYAWICGDTYKQDPYFNGDPVCNLAIAKANIGNWIVGGYKIDYCMIEQVEQKCQLRFSLAIMVVVIISNIVKVSVMGLTIWKFQTPTLVTIGDAMASFLDTPDPNTLGMCLATREIFRKGKWSNVHGGKWAPKKHHWFKAASTKRWLTCNFLCIGFITFGAFMYQNGMENAGISTVRQAWDFGFGKVNPVMTVTIAPTKLIPAVFFANSPQAVLSFLYLTYNGLFSCVLGAHEWTRYSRSKHPLRVTSPRGNQWSTYYLQLPYNYAIPLLILSGGLHWLMSQSLFLALVDVYSNVGEFVSSDSISTVGYSPIAIFSATVIGSIAVIAGIVNGFRTYTGDIPLVGSCSAAISAACHRVPEEPMASLMAVQWGCVDANNGSEVMHCTVSSMDVTAPVPGLVYAGDKGSLKMA